MYIIGFAAAYFVVQSGARRSSVALNRDDTADLIFTVAMGIILGGRTGYILFYNLAYYVANPLKLFAVWEGGMSFHGGLTGGILAGLYFVRKRNLNFWAVADISFMAAPIGLGLGRIGNFINGELYGRITDVPWGVIFPGGGALPRHPSQLYEAMLEGPTMFLILWLIRKRHLPAGVVFWSFIGLYGLFRFMVEFFREPDLQIGYILGAFTMGQMLSLPMLLTGLLMAWRFSLHHE
jgi:phosphatidylglycerol:prolipoprotein diacylglycerol transferase